MIHSHPSPSSAGSLGRMERRYWYLLAAGFLLGLLLLGPVVDPGYEEVLSTPLVDNEIGTEPLKRVATAAPVITPAPVEDAAAAAAAD